MITEKDIYIASCGVDTRGINKALIKVETSILNIDGRDPDNIDSIVLDNPTVNIFKTRSFTMIDLTFASEDDYEFMNLTRVLTDFCKVENSMDEKNGEIPAVCVSICPKEYNGEYVVVGMHAMWMIHQSSPLAGIDTLRFIVENGFMHTYQLNIDEFDIEKAEDEADEELKSGKY